MDKVVDLFILADFKIFEKSPFLPNGKVSYYQPKQLVAMELTTCYQTQGWVDGELVGSNWNCETHTIYGSAGGGGNGAIGNWESGYDEGHFNGFTPDYPHGGNGHGGGGGGSSSSGGGNIHIPNLPPLTPEIIKFPNFENSKADCVLKKLEKQSGSFRQLMKKFDEDFGKNNLYFDLSNTMPDSLYAETHGPNFYVTTMVINGNLLNRPNLSIAGTIIHEAIHVEIYSKLLKLSDKNGEISQLKLSEMLNEKNYPGMFEYYIKYGIKYMQHEKMAADYIKFMVDVLKEFDPTQSDETYKALAWVGLYDTDAWESKDKEFQDKMIDLVEDFNNKGSEPCKQ